MFEGFVTNLLDQKVIKLNKYDNEEDYELYEKYTVMTITAAWVNSQSNNLGVFATDDADGKTAFIHFPNKDDWRIALLEEDYDDDDIDALVGTPSLSNETE